MRVYRLHARDTAVDGKLQVRKILAQPEDPVVHERRNRPILRRGQPVQQALPGVDVKMLCTALGDGGNELMGKFVAIQVVDSQPALHGDGNLDLPLHGMYDVSHFLRVFHKLGAETALARHPV